MKAEKQKQIRLIFRTIRRVNKKNTGHLGLLLSPWEKPVPHSSPGKHWPLSRLAAAQQPLSEMKGQGDLWRSHQGKYSSFSYLRISEAFINIHYQ